jgi:hypothetical protein
MRSTITALQRAIPAAGVVQLVLGLLFWTGNAPYPGRPARAAGGAARARALDPGRPGPPCRGAGGAGRRAAVWGLVVPVVGFTQRELLPGSAHRVIQVIHLLLGVGLIGLAENLATRAKARLAPVA